MRIYRRVSGVCSFLLAIAIGVFYQTEKVMAADPVAGRMQLHDSRLRLTLFAEAPAIVTPIGMAIDAQDRVYVIESHTHHPPANYAGPETDRILVFEDDDGDGAADRQWIFAQGLKQALNLAFSPAGDLYVVCAREVVKLIDENSDGRADVQKQVLWLETTERYAHNSLLGITFDPEGKMYVSRGNTGSRRHALRGSDGSSVDGYGDGGSVIRANSDGSQIERWATGFWNPFDLKFTTAGDLLLVDNDPDARGPNRLLKVVKDGDYGYRSLYGGGGNHPFQGWDGWLPGTLPYVCGTGEAPSGLIDLRQSSFPVEYQNTVLATIWNENSIERFDLRWDESGISAEKSRFLTGPKDFRPVALACDSRGNLYITDWVLVDYPNHGQGRIWRVATAGEGDANTMRPMEYFERDSALAEVKDDSTIDLQTRLVSRDPFIRHRAIASLNAEENAALRDGFRRSVDARLRLAVLLAMVRSDSLPVDELKHYLADSDERVRIAALMAAGTSFDPSLRTEIDTALSVNPVTPRLFESWLAAAQNLQPAFSEAVKTRSKEKSNQIQPQAETQALLRIAKDSSFSDEVRALAVEYIDASTLREHVDSFVRLASDAKEALSIAVLRRLSRDAVASKHNAVSQICFGIANDDSKSLDWRTSAIDCWSRLTPLPRNELVRLLQEQNALALAAADGLVDRLEVAGVKDAIENALESDLPDSVRETLLYAIHGNSPNNSLSIKRPTSLAEWLDTLARGGTPSRGRRIFESKRVGCAKCHRIDGLGQLLGPDLGQVSQSKTRQQIIRAVLEPSAEFPPQYQAWLVATESGQIHRGLQLDHKAGGAIEMIDEHGKLLRLGGDEIVDYRASSQSLMPDDLHQSMSVTELRDLIAFLASPGE